MSEKTLKSGYFIVNKKEFHVSKKPVALKFIEIDKRVVSDIFKHNSKGFM